MYGTDLVLELKLDKKGAKQYLAEEDKKFFD